MVDGATSFAGVTGGDAITLIMRFDNGGTSLINQTFGAADHLGASLNVGGVYFATYDAGGGGGSATTDGAGAVSAQAFSDYDYDTGDNTDGNANSDSLESGYVAFEANNACSQVSCRSQAALDFSTLETLFVLDAPAPGNVTAGFSAVPVAPAMALMPGALGLGAMVARRRRRA